MKTITVIESKYGVTFSKRAEKGHYGIKIEVAGEDKEEALKEARELLARAEEEGSKIYAEYNQEEEE